MTPSALEHLRKDQMGELDRCQEVEGQDGAVLIQAIL
jgi:hypothetical protein